MAAHLAPEQLSPKAKIALLPPEVRDEWLSRQDLRALNRSWHWHARPAQRGPEFRTERHLPKWAHSLLLDDDQILRALIFFLCGGRGSGKTRAGAEWCVDRATVGTYERGALIGTTAAHIRDVMVEGESGLGVVCERRKVRMKYEPSKRRVTIQTRPGRHSRMFWTGYSAETPDLLAGPQHDSAWGDEPASWPPVTDGAGRTVWDNLMLGLRLSDNPSATLTSTPRAKALIKWLLKPENALENGGSVLVSRATIYDNLAYLARPFVEWVTQQYPPGSRLGDQELLGLLMDLGGTMFRQSWWTEPREDGLTRMLDAEEWRRYALYDDNVPREHARLRVRYWDLAATPETGDNDPDWTAGCRLVWDQGTLTRPETPTVVGTRDQGIAPRWVWEHVAMTRDTPGAVKDLILACAVGGVVKIGGQNVRIQPDPPGTIVYIENDRGQAGKSQVWEYQQLLGAHNIACEGWLPSGDKAVRAALPSAWAEAGTLWMVEGGWNAAAFDQLEAFEDGKQAEHDDIVDGLSGGAAVMQKLTAVGVTATGGSTAAEARIGGIGNATGLPRLDP